MSSRAFKKLYGDADLKKIAGISDDEDEELPVASTKTLTSFNALSLLTTSDNSGDEDRFDDHQSGPSEPVVQSKPKKKKKKKSKKLKNEESEEIDEDKMLEEFAAENRTSQPNDSNSGVHFMLKKPLQVDHRYLNPNNEMKRRFGDIAVSKNRTHRKQYRKQTHMVNKSDEWPPLHRSGLSMRLGESQGVEQIFVIEHQREYEKTQKQFWSAVDSMSPDNLTKVLQSHPYHIDTLLQLSEVCRMSEDLQMAADLIERALYAYELNFHPLFNMAGECRLKYRVWENRGLFLALFRHIDNIGNRGCHRTALEYCKLLLSLDTESDPLCVLLMIDFYALRSESYQYLVDLYELWNATRNLKSLPNFAFSVPLALYWLAKSDETKVSAADQMLQSALKTYPGVVKLLLDECGVSTESDKLFMKYFNSQFFTMPPSLRQLANMYSHRCFSCWKDPDSLAFLERNVQSVCEQAETDSGRSLRDESNLGKKIFQNVTPPRNVCRHIVLSDIKDTRGDLPAEYTDSVLSYDPIPPADTIRSYDRPAPPQRRVQELGYLQALLNSLRPNFNVNAVVDENEHRREAAEGGGPQLVEQLRELLNGIRFNLPEGVDDPDALDEINDEFEDQDWEGDGNL